MAWEHLMLQTVVLEDKALHAKDRKLQEFWLDQANQKRRECQRMRQLEDYDYWRSTR